ncbi:unnamed protein product, partial [marine sediment metagenome]
NPIIPKNNREKKVGAYCNTPSLTIIVYFINVGQASRLSIS